MQNETKTITIRVNKEGNTMDVPLNSNNKTNLDEHPSVAFRLSTF